LSGGWKCLHTTQALENPFLMLPLIYFLQTNSSNSVWRHFRGLFLPLKLKLEEKTAAWYSMDSSQSPWKQSEHHHLVDWK
jgi:hypothetical protein